MRLAFFGLPLAALVLAGDGHDLCLAVIAPTIAPGLRRLRRTIGVERVLVAKELGTALDGRIDDRLLGTSIDLLVSWYWTRKLPARWIANASMGAIGAHPSLLPRHRGPNPFFWTIDGGDVESGVTVHRLTENYDDGAILMRVTMPVGACDAWQLARALDRPSLGALRQVVAEFARGSPPAEVPQDEGSASFAPEPSGDELRVDWRWPTERVLRRVRALSPVPGLALELCGVRLFVTRADRAPSFPDALEPGEAAAVGDPALYTAIRTGDGAIRILAAARGAGGPDATDEPEEGEPLAPKALAQLVASLTRAV